MTSDQIVARLAMLTRRVQVLRDDNQRLWDSREEWKRKHRDREAEIVHLRRRVARLEASRSKWRARVPPPPRLRRCKEPNVYLDYQDIKRILRIPARD